MPTLFYTAHRAFLDACPNDLEALEGLRFVVSAQLALGLLTACEAGKLEAIIDALSGV